MGTALNMLAPGEADVSDALLPYDHIDYGTYLHFLFLSSVYTIRGL